jgi:hypothetical protein
MAQLESQRLTVTNLVLSISALVFTFAFANAQQLTLLNGVGLPAAIIFCNLFAMAYIRRCDGHESTDGKRAREILKRNAEGLKAINDAHPWPKYRILNHRATAQLLIHGALVLVFVLPIVVYLGGIRIP